MSPSTAYSYVIGAAGVGVSSADGTTGGDSTFTVGGTVVTAKGGPGGIKCTPSAALSVNAGGAASPISTNGDLNGSGAPGGYGVTLIVGSAVVASGAGGSSALGSGGLGLTLAGTGNAAIGFGGGGGGSATGASVAQTGGNGSAGVIIVDEYT